MRTPPLPASSRHAKSIPRRPRTAFASGGRRAARDPATSLQNQAALIPQRGWTSPPPTTDPLKSQQALAAMDGTKTKAKNTKGKG